MPRHGPNSVIAANAAYGNAFVVLGVASAKLVCKLKVGLTGVC